VVADIRNLAKISSGRREARRESVAGLRVRRGQRQYQSNECSESTTGRTFRDMTLSKVIG
jgi:hypothetical protein